MVSIASIQLPENLNQTASTVTIPTTEELAAYIYEPEALKRIEMIQEDALQRAEVGIIGLSLCKCVRRKISTN